MSERRGGSEWRTTALPPLDFNNSLRRRAMFLGAACPPAHHRWRRFRNLAATFAHVVTTGAAARAAERDNGMRRQDEPRAQQKEVFRSFHGDDRHEPPGQLMSSLVVEIPSGIGLREGRD